MAVRPEFHLFLPQIQLTFDQLVERARAAEGAGFTGIALMDHLVPPGATRRGCHEAVVTATWLAAHTTTLTIGHLVLCDAFRHPALLAKQAVSLDHASGGRFELGIGWGSYVPELTAFGIAPAEARPRVERLAETLAVLEALWRGDHVDHDGDHLSLSGAYTAPRPLDRIPIVIGGTGPRTLALVERHADWWNLPTYGLDRLDALRSRVGRARVSVQQMITFLRAGHDRDEVEATAARRFGGMPGRITGDAATLRAHVEQLAGRGVERIYCWFTDFADPEGLEEFGATVIGPLGAA